MTTQASVEQTEFRGVRVRIATSLAFDEVLGRLRALTGRAPDWDGRQVST